jgi:hypothetical protein
MVNHHKNCSTLENQGSKFIILESERLLYDVYSFKVEKYWRTNCRVMRCITKLLIVFNARLETKTVAIDSKLVIY